METVVARTARGSLGWIALAAFAVIFLGPLAGLFAQADVSVLRETMSSPAFAKSLRVTAISGAVGAAISVALGLYFARHFALEQWRGKRIQRLLFLLPYLIPNFILATAYVIAWNPATGLLNPVLRFPFGLYGLWGMTALFAIVHAPVALLMIEDKYRRMDSSWREAAQLSGAGTWKIMRAIEIPVLLPTIVAAYALVFTLDISAFAIPAWIGAPEHVYPLTYKVYQAIQVGGADGIPEAAAYSVILFLLAIPPLALAAWAGRHERKLVLLGGKASRQGHVTRSRRQFITFQALYWVLQLVFWIGPIACLLASTLVKPGCLQENGFSCFKDASLHPYSYVLFGLDETRIAIRQTLAYGTLSAALILALTIAGLAVFSAHRAKLRSLEWVFAAAVATPGAVIALGLIVTLSGRFKLNLYNTPWILVMAYLLKHTNLAFQPVRTGLTGISSSLVEAARLSGAKGGRIWRSIVLPILKPELMGGFFLVLIPILGELTMSVFLTSPSYRPIGAVMFDLQDYADQTSAGALSILLILLILAMNELARLLSRGKLGY